MDVLTFVLTLVFAVFITFCIITIGLLYAIKWSLRIVAQIEREVYQWRKQRNH